jgi:hypothetical protein
VPAAAWSVGRRRMRCAFESTSRMRWSTCATATSRVAPRGPGVAASVPTRTDALVWWFVGERSARRPARV